MTTQIDAPTDVDQFFGAAGFSSSRRAAGTPFNRILEVRP